MSSFFNNVEHRNKKYLQDYIFSSSKRAKDLKTGLKISKALKQSSKKMSLLCQQMSEDIILKNADILLKEKKLISENTEQETHLKINDLLQNLKTALKTPYVYNLQQTKTNNKSLTKNEIMEAKEYITEKIMKEESLIQDKINKYLQKMHKSLDKYTNDDSNNNKNQEDSNDLNDDEEDSFKRKKIRKKKEFNRYAEKIYIKDMSKFINYIKPKPYQIKDKEGANLKRIKNRFYPPSVEEKIQSKKEKEEDSDSDDDEDEKNDNNKVRQNKTYLNKNNIKKRLNNSNIEENKKEEKAEKNPVDELLNVEVVGRDTIEILNNLVSQGKYLPERIEKKSQRINSLIEMDLPYPINYELILKFNKKLNNNLKQKYLLLRNKSSNEIQNSVTALPDLPTKIKQRLALIKDDIKNIKNVDRSFFNPLAKTYLKRFRKKVNTNNNKNKNVSHKNSMDNILGKKDNTVFITLKNMVPQQKNNRKQRKIQSSNNILTNK